MDLAGFCECILSSCVNMTIAGANLAFGTFAFCFLIWRFVVNTFGMKLVNETQDPDLVVLKPASAIFAILTFMVICDLEVSTFYYWPDKTMIANWLAIAWAVLIGFKRSRRTELPIRWPGH